MCTTRLVRHHCTSWTWRLIQSELSRLIMREIWPAAQEGVEGFLEELVVRRELSDNFCHYEPNYDNLRACSAWAIDSLNAHRNDKREFLYTLCAALLARTDDAAVEWVDPSDPITPVHVN